MISATIVKTYLILSMVLPTGTPLTERFEMPAAVCKQIADKHEKELLGFYRAVVGNAHCITIKTLGGRRSA